MANPRLFGNIKLVVFVGYIILFALALFGAGKIYSELVRYSEKNSPFKERKELSLVSNILVYMYESESLRKVMLTENMNPSLVQHHYVDVNRKIQLYIDSLYQLSSDNFIREGLDTVKYFLNEKELNLKNMVLLLDSIKKLPYSREIMNTTVTRKEVAELNNLFKYHLRAASDTSFFIKKKKKFMDRVIDVFNNKADSTQVIKKMNEETLDSAYILPAKLLTDTVIEHFRGLNISNNKKKSKYLIMLSLRQSEMIYYDELLTTQINRILHEIDQKERKLANSLLEEKETTLRRSSTMVSIIAFASIFTLILFLTLSYYFINRSKNFKNKLEQSKKYSEDLLRSRERLLLMISHDIKSPLSSIIGYVELLSKENMPPSEKTYLNNMRNSSEQILELVNKLMDFHKLEQGKSEINMLTFNPQRLMEDIFQSYIPIVASKGLKFELSNNLNQNEFFESDPFTIKQILNNLLTNAVKFTNSGSVRLTANMKTDENILQITVKDTGVGIKEEDKEFVFEEFGRAGNAESKHRVDGFGLGLAISHKLVQLLGGKIELQSTFGIGSEFIVEIPLVKTVQTTDEDRYKYSNSEEKGKFKANILFIDDDIVFLNVYMKLLEREGATVTTCADSKEVLRLLLQNKFDLIFTDIQMPDINGFELVKRIRNSGISNCSDVPVVALSARSDVSEQEIKAAGFTAFLTKPATFKLLIDTVKHFTSETKRNFSVNSENHKPQNIGIYSMIEFVKEDRNASVEILQVFIDDNKLKINDLKAALERKDWSTIKSNAHKLLPLMRMIGASEIVEILVNIENGEENKIGVKKLIELIESTNKEVVAFIKKEYPEN